MSSEVKRDAAFVPPVRVKENIAKDATIARTKPKPHVFRVGYLGTHANLNTLFKFGSILKEYAAVMKKTEKIDYVEIIPLDEMPVRMNDPPEAKEEADEEGEVKNEFVEEWIKIPKYTTSSIGSPDNRSVEENERWIEFWQFEGDRDERWKFVGRFVDQYVKSGLFNLWLVGTFNARNTALRKVTAGAIEEITENLFRDENSKILLVDTKENAITLGNEIPHADYYQIFSSKRYGTFEAVFHWDKPDDWHEVAITEPKHTDLFSLIRWIPRWSKAQVMVLLTDGSDKHIKATLDWMFSLHKGAVSKAISKGTQERLPQTIEDLVASYSLGTGGKYCHTSKRKKLLSNR